MTAKQSLEGLKQIARSAAPVRVSFPPPSAAQRKRLKLRPEVTDSLIDEVWPSLALLSAWSGKPLPRDARTLWKRLHGEQERTVSAFRLLLDQDRRAAAFLVGQLVKRGVPNDEAVEHIRNLHADLEELSTRIRWAGELHAPRPGAQPDEGILALMDAAASAWQRHVGQPKISETGPFVTFCIELAGLIGVVLDRDNIRRAMARNKGELRAKKGS